jgi:NADH:ubiquinone oxidoreductase subunit F (NADH-binding)
MSLPRLLAGVDRAGPLGLKRHLAVHGPLPDPGPALVHAVRESGLRGRGGAAFPTGVKLGAVAARRGPRVVLVNAAEGDPGSAKDRVLLSTSPHLALDGALLAADAIGARRVVVAVPESARAALEAVRFAIHERGAQRRIQVAPVPTAYLAGEESALIQHLDGGPLKPTVVPPLPAERGLRRRPTLVQNPETLAHIALIARHGPDWFRAVGTGDHPGSALVTLTGAVVRPGVQEIALGTPVDAVLAAAGGLREPLRALLVGGYHGAWIDGAAAPGLTLDDPALRDHGTSLGAGIVLALGAGACPAQELTQGLTWLAAQSAGQCGPCRNGLPGLARLMTMLTAGAPAPHTHELLARWQGDLVGRGACHLPDGAVRFLSSGLRVFASEIAAHEQHGPCPACRRPTSLPVPGLSEGAVAA